MSIEEIKAGLYECPDGDFTIYYNFFLGDYEAIEVGYEDMFEEEWSSFEYLSHCIDGFMEPTHLRIPKEYML